MWKFLLFIAFLVVAVLVFVRLGSIRYRNRPVIGFFPRIATSLLFPVLGLVILLIGSFVVILVAALISLLLLVLLILFLFSKPKIYVYKKKF